MRHVVAPPLGSGATICRAAIHRIFTRTILPYTFESLCARAGHEGELPREVRVRILPDHRTIWRWHFYAGLFCIPFVLWLSVTGSIYLFKPEIEAWLDRPYENLLPAGVAHASAAAQVNAAVAAVPGSSLHFYELPRTEGAAAQVIVGKDADEFRVYVHPATARVLKIDNQDARPMQVLFRLHGELLGGDRGSMLVELAASWTVVMILTGLYLWWPRDGAKLAGVVYPRLNGPGRLIWRDLHSVAGLWVSFFTLFLLFTGLPWAKSWGTYFKGARQLASAVPIRQDWTTGRSSELEQRRARNPQDDMSGMAGMDHSQHGGGGAAAPKKRLYGKKARLAAAMASHDYSAIDLMLPAAGQLKLAYPVQISPPLRAGEPWTVKSDSQNRMLRDTYTLNAATAAVMTHETFYDRGLVDRATSIGISAHEGHLFGLLNQLLGVFTAAGLILVAVSSVVMWWRRRPVGVLGAPVMARRPVVTAALVAIVVLLSVSLPLLGTSILLVALLERLVLRRLPGVKGWLGLVPLES